MFRKISLITRLSFLIAIIYFLNYAGSAYSQIEVYERTSKEELKNKGLFFDSPTRKKIDLNGTWEISFNEGLSYSKFIVPLSYNYSGNAIYKRKFSIPEEIVNSYSFVLVSEGICYQSDISINNNFISNHIGGFSSIVVPLTDGIVSQENEINVKVNSELNYKNTIPLSDQLNYSKVYGGINKDIYLIAVPKLFVFSSYINYRIDNLLSVKVNNTVEIKSSNLFKFIDTSKNKNFYLYTKIVRKSDSSESGKSEKVLFKIGDNNSVKSGNEISISNPVIWTPETPELYYVESVIESESGQVLDVNICESGFTNLTMSGNQFFQSGKPVKINGINYYEDQPKFASTLSYTVTESDLKNIKSLGFNALRVPGRSAHPYIINICNRIGLYLFQEIPFNEVSEHYLKDDKYARLGLTYISEITERDRNSPCIIAWGIGNDFDVSSEDGLNYVKAASQVADSLGGRFTYYTTRAFCDDICSEYVDFTGINFYESNPEIIKNSVNELFNRNKPSGKRKNPNLCVSYYGLNIQNNNTNGFSDSRSQEAQMKFISECFSKLSQPAAGNFIASYADWNSENPLNYPLDTNNYLKTSGLYTMNREQKRSADYVKRILYREDLQRIQEGTYVQDFPYVFIITGIISIVILTYFVNRDKKFRSGLIRCLYKPTYFYNLVKDQMIVTTGYNFLLAILISIGISLFFSSVLYFYKSSNSFDMVLAKLFTGSSFKITVSRIINNKYYLISVLILLNLLTMFFTSFFLYFISFYTKGKSYFKNIFTICVWSTLPMIFFLFAGTIIYKIAETDPHFIKIFIIIFIILYFIYINRLFIGAKTLFDIRTGKVYLYGFIIIFVIFALVYSYLFFFTGVLETISLINNLT